MVDCARVGRSCMEQRGPAEEVGQPDAPAWRVDETCKDGSRPDRYGPAVQVGCCSWFGDADKEIVVKNRITATSLFGPVLPFPCREDPAIGLQTDAIGPSKDGRYRGDRIAVAVEIRVRVNRRNGNAPAGRDHP